MKALSFKKSRPKKVRASEGREEDVTGWSWSSGRAQQDPGGVNRSE